MTTTQNQDAPQNEGTNLNEKYSFRMTSLERSKMEELASKCGLPLSEYLRRVGTGHKPRHRLTPEEVSAIDTLTTCKRQLQQFLNRVKGMTEPQRKMLFKDEAFYKKWRAYCEDIIKQWQNIRENIFET